MGQNIYRDHTREELEKILIGLSENLKTSKILGKKIDIFNYYRVGGFDIIELAIVLNEHEILKFICDLIPETNQTGPSSVGYIDVKVAIFYKRLTDKYGDEETKQIMKENFKITVPEPFVFSSKNVIENLSSLKKIEEED